MPVSFQLLLLDHSLCRLNFFPFPQSTRNVIRSENGVYGTVAATLSVVFLFLIPNVRRFAYEHCRLSR
jgi:hypothetical protein